MNLGVSTGLSFLNGFLDGGTHRASVRAPGTYGSGKTTLATMLAVEARQAHDAERTGGKAHSCLRELRAHQEMRIRAMSTQPDRSLFASRNGPTA